MHADRAAQETGASEVLSVARSCPQAYLLQHFSAAELEFQRTGGSGEGKDVPDIGNAGEQHD